MNVIANGWIRLWLVACVAWAGVLGVYAYFAAAIAPTGSEGDLVRSFALFWCVTSLGALVIGFGVAWAVKGFRTPPAENE